MVYYYSITVKNENENWQILKMLEKQWHWQNMKIKTKIYKAMAVYDF